MKKAKQSRIMNIIMTGATGAIVVSILLLIIINTGKTSGKQGQDSPHTDATADRNADGIKVTFIELGSVRCIPCKMMQPVMKAIEEKYPGTVKVVFHDVWTDEGKPYGASYNIKAIPTQIFLDSNGVEYFRHEGFFPQEELEKILKMKL